MQLDQICISFDEGKTTMNFVEAALLIQGSACVYSKKVGAPDSVLLEQAHPVSDLPSCIPRHLLMLNKKLVFKIAGPASIHTSTCRRAPHCKELSSPQCLVPSLRACCRARGKAGRREHRGEASEGWGTRKRRSRGEAIETVFQQGVRAGESFWDQKCSVQ